MTVPQGAGARPTAQDLFLPEQEQRQIIQEAIQSRTDSKNHALRGYVLALSWSPGYCMEQDKDLYQCRQDFTWVIHGLWPQGAWADNGRDHPFACGLSGREAPIDMRTLERGMALLPSARLVVHQWFKHGVCVEGVKTPDDYFAMIEHVDRSLVRPILSGRMTVGEIKQAFIVKNPRFRSSHIYVVWRGGRLREVRLCFDRAFLPTDCLPGDRSSRADARSLAIP